MNRSIQVEGAFGVGALAKPWTGCITSPEICPSPHLDILKKELENTSRYKEPPVVTEERKRLKSHTDPDCCYVNQPRIKGLGYLCEMTVDTGNGSIPGVDCFGANRRENDNILKHLHKQQEILKLDIKHLTLDSGYDVGAVSTVLF